MRQTQKRIANRCLSIMRGNLRKNICNLPSYGTSREEITSECIEQHLPADMKYSCRYWAHHMSRSPALTLQVDVFLFLKEHFLHWFEVMSILGLISEFVDITGPLYFVQVRFNPTISQSTGNDKICRIERARSCYSS